MKTFARFLIAFAIMVIPVVLSAVIAHYAEKDLETVYCHVVSFVIGVLSPIVAGQIINKITDKHE